jgi:hypothetical protein
MSEAETADSKQEKAPSETHLKKQQPRYGHEDKGTPQKISESQRWPTGKKQRQPRKR